MRPRNTIPLLSKTLSRRARLTSHQRWNFTLATTLREVEDYHVELSNVADCLMRSAYTVFRVCSTLE